MRKALLITGLALLLSLGAVTFGRGELTKENIVRDGGAEITELYYATNCVSCWPSSRSGCLIIDNF
ncbi:MAG: hypothetical protein U9Q76_00890 [candidate division WOR-3 bacterium]|nr:hypothetical protein [candidate division WOR-3 bacterium]